jgi:hypothetical protein
MQYDCNLDRNVAEATILGGRLGATAANVPTTCASNLHYRGPKPTIYSTTGQICMKHSYKGTNMQIYMKDII